MLYHITHKSGERTDEARCGCCQLCCVFRFKGIISVIRLVVVLTDSHIACLELRGTTIIILLDMVLRASCIVCSDL